MSRLPVDFESLKHTPEDSPEAELYAACAMIERMMNRKWLTFKNEGVAKALMIDPPPDRLVALLGVAVCKNFFDDDPLHKSMVGEVIGVGDVKTARKCIARAEAMGLVRVEQAQNDRRKELLLPTDLLVVMMY